MLTSDDLIQWNDAPNDYEVTGRVKVTDDTTQFDAGSLTAGYDASADNYRVALDRQRCGQVRHHQRTSRRSPRSRPVLHSLRRTADLSGIDNAVTSNTIAVTKDVAGGLAESLAACPTPVWKSRRISPLRPTRVPMHPHDQRADYRRQTLENGNLLQGCHGNRHLL